MGLKLFVRTMCALLLCMTPRLVASSGLLVTLEACTSDGQCFSRNCTNGVCSCIPGVLGPRCQFSNAATCSNHGNVNNDGTCTCTSDYFGPNCGLDCSTFGTPNLDTNKCVDCRAGSSGDFCQCITSPVDPGKCVCVSGFTGDDCTARVTESTGGDCNARGSRSSLGAECICSSGFAGPNCEFSDAAECSGRGKVSAVSGAFGNGYECACDEPYATRDDKSKECDSTFVSIDGRTSESCRDAVIWASQLPPRGGGEGKLGLDEAIAFVNEMASITCCSAEDFEFCTYCDKDHTGPNCDLTVCATNAADGESTGTIKFDEDYPIAKPRTCECNAGWSNSRCECFRDFTDPMICIGCAQNHIITSDGACERVEPTAPPTVYDNAIEELAATDPALLISLASAAGLFGLFIALLSITTYCSSTAEAQYEARVWAKVYAIACFSVLDFTTDVTYLIYEPFANESYRQTAIIVMGVPIIVLALYFMVTAYRLISKENLSWRFSRGVSAYGAYADVDSWNVCDSVPKSRKVCAWFVAYTAGILASLITELHWIILLIPEMLIGLLALAIQNGSSLFYWFYDIWPWQRATDQLIFVPFVFGLGPVLLLTFGTIGMVMTFVLAVLFPILWSVMMISRVYILFPSVWGVLLTMNKVLLLPKRTPVDNAAFTWDTYDEEEAREMLDNLFFPKGGKRTESTGTEENDMGSAVYYLTTMLIYEFVFETIPQVAIQITNNNANEEKNLAAGLVDVDTTVNGGWGIFTYASVGISAYISMSALYDILVGMIYFERELGDVRQYKATAFKGEEALRLSKARKAQIRTVISSVLGLLALTGGVIGALSVSGDTLAGAGALGISITAVSFYCFILVVVWWRTHQIKIVKYYAFSMIMIGLLVVGCISVDAYYRPDDHPCDAEIHYGVVRCKTYLLGWSGGVAAIAGSVFLAFLGCVGAELDFDDSDSKGVGLCIVGVVSGIALLGVGCASVNAFYEPGLILGGLCCMRMPNLPHLMCLRRPVPSRWLFLHTRGILRSKAVHELPLRLLRWDSRLLWWSLAFPFCIPGGHHGRPGR